MFLVGLYSKHSDVDHQYRSIVHIDSAFNLRGDKQWSVKAACIAIGRIFLLMWPLAPYSSFLKGLVTPKWKLPAMHYRKTNTWVLTSLKLHVLNVFNNNPKTRLFLLKFLRDKLQSWHDDRLLTDSRTYIKAFRINSLVQRWFWNIKWSSGLFCNVSNLSFICDLFQISLHILLFHFFVTSLWK